MEDEFEIDYNNEFINSEDDYGSSSVFGGNITGGGFGGALLLSVLVVAVLYFLYINFSKSKQPSYILRNKKCRTGVQFDSLLVPSSYFDYTKHGRNYINWL